MHEYLFRSKRLKQTKKTRKFQIIDYYCKDEENEYVIHLFGVTKKGYSIHAKINSFKPYFFIKVPEYFCKTHEKILLDYLKEKIWYVHKENVLNVKILKKKDYYGFTNNKQFKYACIYLSCKGAVYACKKLFQKPIRIPRLTKTANYYQIYEGNIEPFLRFLHIQNINSSGWVSIENYSYLEDSSRCQINIETNWKNVVSHKSDAIAPIIIASFDIECTSGDGSFPQPDREADQIIQIGTTVYIQGLDNEKKVLKHIVTLNTCDNIDGVIVEHYETESEVLLAWMKFIQKLDPDIITGYNIFGFDFEYMYERSRYLDIESEFCQLGRLNDIPSELMKKRLSSSALGQNDLKILTMSGRLLIDLFKVIQRDYKFASYKLDYVASQFIQNKIINISENMIETSNTTEIKVGDYISFLNYKTKTKLKLNDKYKFKVVNLTSNNIYLEEKIEIKDLSDIKWCQAKDNVSPNQIFEFQKKDSKHRALIAKYCVQDCLLCNRLFDKLDILPNNIGMSNVCYVPMSYLFLRGQGIKAYSLVAKQCREDGYLIPEFKKTIVESDYQGATVLEARAGEYFCPVSCNDFASLYPSSIISHNLSPDTLVNKSKYDNLDKIKYHNIKLDGKSYRFVLPEEGEVESARKGRGIIPRILIYLLQSRKNVKKQMKSETNPFKKSLLDGLQLAYKLTCNSIYGQLGAPTSPIYCKPIAECTTAVGRELLKFSRDEALKLFPGTVCVYGDSVTEDTPLLLKNGKNIVIKSIGNLSDSWIKSGDKEYANCKYKVWSDKGWTKIKNIVRHKVSKNIYRVLTHTGCVDVTEDHSLLNESEKEITPKECNIGDKLLHNYPTVFENNKEMCVFKSKSKLQIAKKYLEYKKHSKNLEIDFIDDTYYLYQSQSCTNSFVKKIINLGNTEQYVYDLTTENHHFQAGIGDLIVHNTDSIFLKYPLKSKIIDKTDPKQKALLIQESIDKAKIVEKKISAMLPWPHNLEYEKTYFPYILYSKKRYSGIMYEENPNKISKIDNKGIVLKRRDNAPIVKHIFGGALNIILYKQNIEFAKNFVKKCLKDLFNDKFDLNYFIVTKTLKITKTTPAHRILATRIAERDPGNAPQLNDRIPYIYIYLSKKQEKNIINIYNSCYEHENKDSKFYQYKNDKLFQVIIQPETCKLFLKKAKRDCLIPVNRKDLLQGDRIEHPDYIRKNNLKVDYKFYVTNQLTKPLTELFSIFIKNKNEKEQKNIVYKELFEEQLRKENNKRNGQSSILSFFKK